MKRLKTLLLFCCATVSLSAFANGEVVSSPKGFLRTPTSTKPSTADVAGQHLFNAFYQAQLIHPKPGEKATESTASSQSTTRTVRSFEAGN